MKLDSQNIKSCLVALYPVNSGNLVYQLFLEIIFMDQYYVSNFKIPLKSLDNFNTKS
jgi:hypothetical protein